MKQRLLKGGYIGLLALLFSVCIMVLLMWMLYLKPSSNTNTAGYENGGTVQTVPQGLEAINQAKEARNALEHRSSEGAE